jgi:hypothetical protein
MIKLVPILAFPLALLAAVASLGMVVVDVREGGPDGHRIVVPVPLLAAQTALLFAPLDKHHVPLEHAARHLPVAREALAALAEGPDGVLVLVEERDQRVRISKAGDTLEVRVQGNGEEVAVNVPLTLAMSALPDEEGRISRLALAGALTSTRFSKLVDVRNGKDHVSISVW